MNRYLRVLVGILAVLVVNPAWAEGKKSGVGESGGGGIAPIGSTGVGPREIFIPPEQASQSLGTVLVAATMMAGAGAGKCRMNFVVTNMSTTTITMGAVGTATNDKGDVTDNWVISIGSLAPNAQAARLFSCALGAVKLTLTPLGEFSWPPLKCAKPDKEPEACPLGMQIRSSLPIAEKK
ncbi:MAG: hypothetical protein Q7R40_10165 [Phaeospirillum sp.]|nr:hypothetical protein [Phaeospirillum sp.]